ncbi:MAG: ParB/RepB/Spo0J family partition protein [Bacillota bacterium]
MAKRSLGKGLSALMGEYKNEELLEGEQITLLSVKKIDSNPDQPRKFFAEDKLQELSDSIKEFGLLQPIIVVEKGKRYEIVAGERRWRAAIMAGLQEIPCIVRQLSEGQITEFSLIENIQREDLNVLEEAQTYQKLQNEFGYTQKELASRLGKSRPHVANTLRLLSLSPSVQAMLINGRLTAGHGRAILSLDKVDDQNKLAQRVIAEGLSVRQTEFSAHLLSGQIVEKKPTHRRQKSGDNDLMVQDITKHLREKLATKVSLEQGKKGGKIVIEYYDTEDLERLLEQLLPDVHF